MAFNHYAKLKRIIEAQPPGWFIRRINEPTTTKGFDGTTTTYDYYYRLYDKNDRQIPYGKFQKPHKLASILKTSEEHLPIVDNDTPNA